MPRPHKCRCIFSEPNISVFKPKGVPAYELEAIELRLDELEAIRLADLEGLYQEEAAKMMNISRATFGRIVDEAHHKIASALLNGKMIIFKGGNIKMSDKRTFVCADCEHRFQVPYGTQRPQECPSCHSHNIHRAPEERGGRRWGRQGFGRGQSDKGPKRLGLCMDSKSNNEPIQNNQPQNEKLNKKEDKE